jgi:histidinol-phosphatase (PHP family)
MSWANLHSHSSFCDGKADPEDFIKAAIEKSFIAYGYSSHAPTCYQSIWNMEPAQMNDYISEICRLKTKYAGEIEIYTGLEQDYIQGMTVPDYLQKDFDYIIGSVHYIGKYPDGSGFCFDGKSEAFFKGILEVFDNDFRKAITAYFELSKDMIRLQRPDIIGHLDKIKMHNNISMYLNEQDTWYENLVNDFLDTIKKNDCIAEVNTRGTYRRNPPMLYPSRWILERIYQKKIPVMINSDAHHPSEIDLGFSATARLLKEIGFKTLRILHQGKWQELPFTEKGMVV